MLLCATIACAPAGAQSPVEIVKGKVESEIRIDHLPRRITGDTDWFFRCHPDFHYERLQSAPNEARLKIDSVRMDIGLNIIQVLPEKRTKKLEQHENGHEQICRMLYADAEKHAKAACEAALGQTFTATGSSDGEAVDKAIEQCSKFICNRYIENTGNIADRVSAEYDNITQHGFNPMPEKKAIEIAFKKVGVVPPAR